MTVDVLVVDDEPLARRRLCRLLENRPGIVVADVCSNGKQAVEAIERLAPHLVFLDIQMPEMDGFEVVATIGAAAMPVVVFVTAYDQYALAAFEAQALDYLLKPFEDERFEQALERAVACIKKDRVDDLEQRLSNLLAEVKPATPPPLLTRIPVQARNQVYFVAVEDLIWMGSEGAYVRLVTKEGDHLIRETLKNLEASLDGSCFLRIHRSTIINMRQIKTLFPRPHGEYDVEMHGGAVLRLSRSYREQAMRRLGL